MFVTPLYAALLTGWFLVLTLVVIRHRQEGSVSLGDGGNPVVQRVIRGHANFTEYVPLALIMLAILELDHISAYILHALGIALLLGRILHGYALSFMRRWMFGRAWGFGLTVLVLVVESLLCLYKAVQGHLLWIQGA